MGSAATASDWDAALTSYRVLRAASDALPSGHPDEDAAVDRYCVAMDALIALPAPKAGDLLLKLDLISDRQDGFGLVPEYYEAVRRDVARLAAVA